MEANAYQTITDDQILQALNGQMVEIEGDRNYTIKFDGKNFVVEVFSWTTLAATITSDETNLRLIRFY